DGDTPAQSVSTRLIELFNDGIVHREKVGTFLYCLFQEKSTIANEESIEFEEGQISYRLHLSRERNPKVIYQAKENFFKKHGKLYCQACNFDFEEKYGMLGKDFIEGHHTLPLSKMFERHKTKPEDIAMLCANCHR